MLILSEYFKVATSLMNCMLLKHRQILKLWWSTDRWSNMYWKSNFNYQDIKFILIHIFLILVSYIPWNKFAPFENWLSIWYFTLITWIEIFWRNVHVKYRIFSTISDFNLLLSTRSVKSAQCHGLLWCIHGVFHLECSRNIRSALLLIGQFMWSSFIKVKT